MGKIIMKIQEDKMLKKIYTKRRNYLLIISLLIIFMFSLQSGDLSYRISDFVAAQVVSIAEILGISGHVFGVHGIDYIVRKCAHVILYFLLGIGVTATVGEVQKKKSKEIKYYYITWGVISCSVCTVFAIIDEGIQVFRSGRQGLISDIFIDAYGYLTGILLIVIIQKLIENKKKRR